MNLELVVDKVTCFYYWVQALSEWSIYPPESEAYAYYKSQACPLTETQKEHIVTIGCILKESPNPRAILAELYTATPISSEAKRIVELAAPLSGVFEPLWSAISADLGKWGAIVSSGANPPHEKELAAIVSFFGSSFDIGTPVRAYFLQNSPNGSSLGHAIENTGFMLVHPASTQEAEGLNATLSTITHEYIHLIEFQSHVTRSLFRRSYEEYIKPLELTLPEEYTWKMMYMEVFVYCFANNITGGYFRPNTHGKPRPTLAQMEPGFWSLVNANRHNTHHVISWVALSILEDVELYLQTSKVIDRTLVDKVTALFLRFYSTHKSTPKL